MSLITSFGRIFVLYTHVLLCVYCYVVCMYYTSMCTIIDDTGRTAHTQGDASEVCCGR